MRGALLAATALVAAAVATAEDWPRFRGPNGSGVSLSKGLPAGFGPAKNLAWKAEVPFGRSSPVVAGDRIFLTAGEGAKLITMALERSSGRILWRREIARTRVTSSYKANDPASPTPVTDGGNVYVFFPDLGLVSYAPDGAERWRLELGPFDAFYGLASSPILAGDTLLLVCDTRAKAFMVAVDTASGRVRWRIDRTDIRWDGFASPVVWEPKGRPAQIIVLGVHRLDAYALATGERLWWVGGLAFLPVASPVLANGLVLVSTWGGDTPSGPTFDEWLKKDSNGDSRISREEATSGEAFDEFGALDLNHDGFIDRGEWDQLRNAGVGDFGMLAVRLGGRGDLTRTGIAWRNKKTYDTITSPLIYRNVLYLVKSGGIIASLDPRTGQVYKTGRTKEAMDTYYASPVAADGKVFFTSESGKVTVVKAVRQWEILAVNDLGEPCYATPAIADGKIYLRTRNALYCFGRGSGKQRND